MKYKAVLFDLDGTLLDTLQDIAGSTNRALQQLGFPQHEVATYKYFIGDGREALAFNALPGRHRDATTVRKLVELINTEYSRCWPEHTVPFHGIAALLDTLTTRNYKIAILTNKEHGITQQMVSVSLSRWHFDRVVGASPHLPKKPDPTAALQIARQLDILPAEIVFLGDSDIDIKTAKGAGMYPAGAVWGFRTRDELAAAGAEALLEHPSDMLRFL